MARKGTSKVRTGCFTCKVRKVKCDETEPCCKRCTSTGRRCDGYPRSRVNLPLHESLLVRTNSSHDDERRAFAYFQQVAGPALSGQCDPYFWTNLVMQLSHREPAARHAVVALSSLYEQFQDAANSSFLAPTNHFTLRHYNAAIKEVLSVRDETVTLFVCVVFLCVELLQGNTQSAIDHCRNGVLILNKAGESLTWARDYLLAIYCRLSIFPFFFGCTASSFPYVAGLEPVTPTHFTSITDAQSSLDVILSISIRFIRSFDDYRLRELRHTTIPISMRKVQDRLETSLNEWHCAFSEFQTTSPLPDCDSLASCLLQMKFLVVRIWVNMALEQSEMVYDRHVDKFQSIVDLASRAAKPRSHVLNHSHRPRFICDMGFTPLLYFVAMKCRSLSIRLAALSLMKVLGVDRETLWNLNTMYRVARRLVEIEHGINLDDISVHASLFLYAKVPPEEKRIKEVMLDPEMNSRRDVNGREELWTQMHSIMWKPANDLVMQTEWIAIS